jgi:hypothetical protein
MRIMKLLWNFLQICLCFIVLTSIATSVLETSVSPSAGQPVVVKWLSNGGWEIQIGQTIILIDPFLTRREAVFGVEWKTDEETATLTRSTRTSRWRFLSTSIPT